MTERDNIGSLAVVVLKGKDLPDKHSITKQDAFAQVKLGDGTTYKTQVDIRGGQHPLWDEEFHVPVSSSRTLEVSCWSKEPRGDELVGSGTVDISDTLRTGEFDDWVKLSREGVQRGELYLEMTFYSAGPAPLSRRPTKMKPTERLHRPTQPATAPPPTPPKSGGSSPALGPKLSPAPSPRAGTAHLVPPSLAPGGGAHGTSPHASPHGSRTSSPHGARTPSPYGVNAPSPAMPSGGADFIPPLLRPGNPHASPQPAHEVNPLPPNDPLHARLSEPRRVASPPLGASAYPPAAAPATYPTAQDTLGLSQSPPFGRTSPNSFYAPPASQPPYTSSTSPAPPFGSPGLVPGRGDPSTGTPGFSFPVPQTASPPGAVPQAPQYSGGWPSSPPKPRYVAESYASSDPPRMPGGYAWEDAPRQARPPARVAENTYRAEPPLPDPFAAHPVLGRLPARLDFGGDESGMSTPRGDVQPRHQPAAPSHLRHAADADADAARALDREEQERAARLSEQEQRDLELARQLDRELNLNAGE